MGEPNELIYMIIKLPGGHNCQGNVVLNKFKQKYFVNKKKILKWLAYMSHRLRDSECGCSLGHMIMIGCHK